MESHRLLVANWKMNLRPSEEINFVKKHYDRLVNLAKQSNTQIVLCPTFLSIMSIAKNISSNSTNTYLSIGAQDCSTRAIGSFTGQISAACLAEIGCTHVIVGHSEERRAHKESNLQVAHKTIQLLIHGLTPIVCIGESASEKQTSRSKEVLSTQIKTVIDTLNKLSSARRYNLCIAYEPLYAIGSGNVPTTEHLEEIFGHIMRELRNAPSIKNITYLYGGSVNSRQLPMLKKVSKIQGYLVGNASLSFQEMEKMLTSWMVSRSNCISRAEK
ncbi:triosephosphate isomerase [Candidatus Babeliales bacterium]|nr:triosephosphate isomerase [Candidatus Babeliales bacterium]